LAASGLKPTFRELLSIRFLKLTLYQTVRYVGTNVLITVEN